MKLKFHLENDNEGVLLLEAPPQRRTIITTGNKYSKSMDFPYVLFTIRYFKHKGKFVYPGIYLTGLRVFSSQDSIQSTKGMVGLLSIECQRNGLSCTNHADDGKPFDNLHDLADFVIGSWWNHQHDDWPRRIQQCYAAKPDSYKRYLTSSNCSNFDLYDLRVANFSEHEKFNVDSSDFNFPSEIDFMDEIWDKNTLKNTAAIGGESKQCQ